ncbi:MAG TPA: hypothetical protein VKT82_28080 [Ktedonobacterales bacterium]|nr:hypothetical protein [Ktedonobacterales bacterium]
MFPPYSTLKVVHDQMIQEELEHYRANDRQPPRRHGLSQKLGKTLARFTARPAQKPEMPLSCNVQEETCTFA